MLFSSSLFLSIFLPLCLLGYWLLDKKFRNLFLLIASLFFYAWGEPVFVFILGAYSVLNYFLGKTVSKNKKNLALYIVLNIGLLVVCKYVPSIINQIEIWLDVSPVNKLKLSFKMPLGVSFYVFHAISYGILKAKKVLKTDPTLSEFLLYLFLFPHQIAGPIVPINLIENELKSRSFDFTNFNAGMKKFTIGLAKKALLSNGFSTIIILCNNQSAYGEDAIFAWIEILAYTFHIYFDFSGYSDMAIGLAKIFGFHFPENFNKPYISRSITEFWKRWHISLGSFMRDYIYIPLGGNKKGKSRTLFNLGIVFLISGIWHGSNWTFIFWGIFHGTFIILERLFLLKFYAKIPILPWLVTFSIITHGWVFFHESSLENAWNHIGLMWSFNTNHFITTGQDIYVLFYFSIAICYILFEFGIEFIQPFKNLYQKLKTLNWLSNVSSMLLYFICYSFILAGNENPFIYFNF